MSFFLFFSLPLELQSLILSKCGYRDLYHFSQTSKSVKKRVENDEWMWSLKIQEDFGSYFHFIHKEDSWRKTYQFYRGELGIELLAKTSLKDTTRALRILDVDTRVALLNKSKRECLQPASMHGLLPIIERLVECGVGVDAVFEQNYTALIWASRFGQISIVRFLVERGADVNKQNCYGYTSLEWASENSHLLTVRILLENGADVNMDNCYGETALSKASRYGHLDIVRELLDANADPNHQNTTGDTALIQASYRNEPDIVKLLCERNADPYLEDKAGYTALRMAATPGIIDILKGKNETISSL